MCSCVDHSDGTQWASPAQAPEDLRGRTSSKSHHQSEVVSDVLWHLFITQISEPSFLYHQKPSLRKKKLLSVYRKITVRWTELLLWKLCWRVYLIACKRQNCMCIHNSASGRREIALSINNQQACGQRRYQGPKRKAKLEFGYPINLVMW